MSGLPAFARKPEGKAPGFYRPVFKYLAALFLAYLAFYYISDRQLIKELSPSTYDVVVYFNYCVRIINGELPFINFTVEYPPLAVPFFLFPALLSRWLGQFNLETYSALFYAQCFITEAATLWVSYGLLKKLYPQPGPGRAPSTSGLLWFSLGAAALSVFIFQRFDIAAAFFLSLGLYCAYTGRAVFCGTSLALGTCVKLYPALVLPLAFLFFWYYRQDRRKALYCLAAFGLTSGLVILPVLVINPPGLLSVLTYHSERGLQMESVYASILFLLRFMNLVPATLSNDHSSWNVVAPPAAFLASAGTLLTIASLLAVFAYTFIKVRAGKNLDKLWLAQSAGLAVFCFIIFNKVLSPQYLIWLLSFVPFWRGAKPVLLLLAALLSTAVFPFLYDSLIALDALTLGLLILRNILLLALLWKLGRDFVAALTAPAPAPGADAP